MRKPASAPSEKTPPLRVTISDIAFGGDGVARAPDGRALFVPFTLPGEDVLVEVRSSHKRFLRGEVREVLTPAAERVAPRCPLFGRCGGCQYQHLAYEAQVALKVRQLQSALTRLGGIVACPVPLPVVASPRPYGYRNKLRLEAGRKPQGAPGSGDMQYGFYALDNETLFAVTDCPLARPELTPVLAKAIHSPAAKANARLREPQPLTLRLPAVGEPCAYFDNGGGGDATTSPAHPPVEELTELLCVRPVQVPLRSFWQINPEVADELATVLRAWFAESATPVVVDAYAGVGVFSLALAGSGAQVVVIEADAAAVAVAGRNLEAWGVTNAELLTGKTESLLAPALQRFAAAGQETTVVLDPPRTGCADAVVDALRNTPVRQILYVSCNAATLARDVKAFVADQRYTLTRLALFDMFPQTMHFETLALLTRAE